jgi:hypothetical protein
MAEPAADAIPAHRRTDCPTDDETCTSGSVTAIATDVDHQPRGSNPSTFTDRRGEVLAPAYPPFGRQHRQA